VIKMSKVKLVIISGMSGVGKSSTAQKLAALCKSEQINHTWYHEEMDNHPIRWADGGEFSVGPIETREGMARNLEDMYQRWEKLVNQMKKQDGLHIMEGCLFQAIIRYFFHSPLTRGEVMDYYHKVFEILEPLSPHIIFLYRPNVEESFKKAFKIRGERWKNIILDSEDEYYFKSHEYKGEESVYLMEADYQNFAGEIFDSYKGHKLKVDTSGEKWKLYMDTISHFLDIKPKKKLQHISVKSLSQYCGTFEFTVDNQKQTIQVIQENNQLYARFSWFKYVEMHMIDEHYFELLSFPIYFRYSFKNEEPIIDVSGNYGWNIIGQTLYKIS